MIGVVIRMHDIFCLNPPKDIAQYVIRCQYLGLKRLTDDLAALCGSIRCIGQYLLVSSQQIEGEPGAEREEKYQKRAVYPKP